MTSAAHRRRARARGRGLLVVLVLVLVPALTLVALPEHHLGAAGADGTTSQLTPHPAWMNPPPAVLTIRATTGGRPVPRSFFGLSTEYWTLPVYEQHERLFTRVLDLLHVRGSGPIILRVGGDSASHARWNPHSRTVPPWVLGLTPRWLAHMRSLVHRSAIKLILDLNASTGSARAAASWARAATARLPRGSITGFEVGNEPDVFDRTFRIAALTRASGPMILPRPISGTTYAHDFTAFARQLARRVPGVPLLGPALASPRRAIGWIPDLLATPHRGLAVLTAHDYLYSGCARPGTESYPTVAKLLNPPAAWAHWIRIAARSAHRAGLAFRLTEMNSVDCGGLAGVSDTFATALWAQSALFTVLGDGVDGVNLHTRAYPVNAPFWFKGGALEARPLLYGLLLFARTLGPGARLVPVHLRTTPGQHLEAWGVRLRGHILHVLVLDKSPEPASVRLRIRGARDATVQRLLAPFAGASSGVTLAGQHLDAAGRWTGRFVTTRLARQHGGYALRLAGSSAELISVRLG